MPAKLRVPEIPAALEHLWQWFCELSGSRSGNGGGPNPIAYSDIAAWAALTGRLPAPRDVHAIVALDQAFFTELAEQDRRRDAARRQREARGAR
jgi:hypothetical protein